MSDTKPGALAAHTKAPALSTELVQAAEKAADFVKQSIPINTQRAYTSDWTVFSDWCLHHRVPALPADPRVIASFIADQSSKLRPASLRRRLASIAKMHKVAGHTNPCAAEPVPSTMKGIEMRYGAAVAAKAPATRGIVERLVAACPTDTLYGLRNRAMILLGYAGAFRRSELVGLDGTDLEWTAEGVIVTVRRSKTDQRGEGIRKAIPYVDGPMCAAKALKGWMIASGVGEGPLFCAFDRSGNPKAVGLSPQSVALVIKAAATAAGISPKGLSGHSLRAGHVTEARALGVSDADTMSVTGHKRVETLNMYDRRHNLFQKSSAGAVLGTKGGAK